jgi:hypothetical protein
VFGGSGGGAGQRERAGKPHVNGQARAKARKRAEQEARAKAQAAGLRPEEVLTGNFGWHMWTQAFIGGKWKDLDATTVASYGVGHIMLATNGWVGWVAVRVCCGFSCRG